MYQKIIKENNDSFDKVFSNASHSQKLDNYDNLLDVQILIETLNLSMTDFQKEFNQFELTIDSEFISNIVIKISNT